MAFSKRKRSNIKASLIRSQKHNSSGSRKIDIILPAIKPLFGPPQNEKRVVNSPPLYHPPEFKQRRWHKRSDEEKKQKSKFEEMKRLRQLEKKWNAVFTYARYQKADGSIPSGLGKTISSKCGYSLKHLKELFLKAKCNGSLLRNPGGGRKKTIFDTANQSLKEVFQEYGGELSQLTLTELVNKKGVKVSLIFNLFEMK